MEKSWTSQTPKPDSVSQEVPAAPVDFHSVSTPTLSVPKTTPAPYGENVIDRALPNEEALRLALQKGALNQGPLYDLGRSQSAPRQKCSTCGQSKAAHQPWEDHNCSEGHIKNLINKRGFFAAIGYLDQEYSKFLTARCDLCFTNYSSILLLNAPSLQRNIDAEAKNCSDWSESEKSTRRLASGIRYPSQRRRLPRTHLV